MNEWMNEWMTWHEKWHDMNGAQPFISYCVVLDNGWYGFQLKYWNICFGFRKIQVPDPASRDLWSHQHYKYIVQIQFQISPQNED